MLLQASTNLFGALFWIILSPFSDSIALSFFIQFSPALSIFNVALTFFLGADNRTIIIEAMGVVNMFKNLSLFNFKKPSSRFYFNIKNNGHLRVVPSNFSEMRVKRRRASLYFF